MLVGHGTNSYSTLPIGSAGTFLKSDGTTALWATAPTSTLNTTLLAGDTTNHNMYFGKANTFSSAKFGSATFGCFSTDSSWSLNLADTTNASSIAIHTNTAGNKADITVQSNSGVDIIDIKPSDGLYINHLIGNTGTPTIAAGTGAGTVGTPTATMGSGSDDLSGYVIIGTTVSPAINAIVATITFSKAYTSAPLYVDITAGDANSVILSGATMVYSPVPTDTNGATTTTFKIISGTAALTGSLTYKFRYHVIQ